MSGSLSKAMEQGCWCELQGAYFANWNISKMVIPYAMVGAEWWDAHFLSSTTALANPAHQFIFTSERKTERSRRSGNSLRLTSPPLANIRIRID